MDQFQERIKYYSDTPRGEKNKYFVFECPILKLKEFLFLRIDEGHKIRTAYYEKLLLPGRVVLLNKRINLQWIVDNYFHYIQLGKSFETLDTFVNLGLFDFTYSYRKTSIKV